MNNQNEFIDVEAEAIDDKNLNRAERLVGFVDRLFDRIRRAVQVAKNLITAPFRAVKAVVNCVRDILGLLNPRSWGFRGIAMAAALAMAVFGLLLMAAGTSYENKSGWEKLTGPGRSASAAEKVFHETGKRVSYWSRETDRRDGLVDKTKAAWSAVTLEEKPSAPARAGNALGRLFK